MSDEIKIVLTGDASGAEAALALILKKLNDLDTTAKGAGEGAGSAVDKLFKRVSDGAAKASEAILRWTAILGGIATGGGLVAATKAAMEYEKALHDVASVSEDVAVNLKAYDAGLKSIASGSSKDLTDITKGMYQAISAGIPATMGAGGALDFLNTAQKAATAGLASVKDAVTVGALAMNTFGSKAGTATEVFDALQTVVSRGVTRFPELASTLGNVSTAASQAGVGFHEMLASVTLLTKGGLDAAKSTDALRALITAINSPTGEAIKLFKALHIEYGTSAIEAKGLGGVVASLIDKTGGSAIALRKLIPDVIGLQAAQILAKDSGRALRDEMDAQANSAGAVAKAAEQQEKTVTVATERMHNAWKVFSSDVFDKFGPQASEGIDKVSASIKKIDAEKIAGAIHAIGDAIGWIVKKLGDAADAADNFGRRLGAMASLPGKLGALIDAFKSGKGVNQAALDLAGTGLDTLGDDGKYGAAAKGLRSLAGGGAVSRSTRREASTATSSEGVPDFGPTSSEAEAIGMGPSGETIRDFGIGRGRIDAARARAARRAEGLAEGGGKGEKKKILEDELQEGLNREALKGMTGTSASNGVDWVKLRKERIRNDQLADDEAEAERLSAHLHGGSASDVLAQQARSEREGFFGSEGMLATGGKMLGGAALGFGMDQLGALVGMAGNLSNEADPAKVKLEQENVAAAKDKLDRATTESARISAQHELDKAQQRLEREQGGQFNAAVGEKFDAAKAFIENIVKNLPTLFKMIGKELPGLANDLLDAVIAGFPKIFDSIVAAAGPMIGKLIALIVPKIPDLALAMVTGVIDAFIANMDKLVVGIAEGIGKALIALIDKFNPFGGESESSKNAQAGAARARDVNVGGEADTDFYVGSPGSFGYRAGTRTEVEEWIKELGLPENSIRHFWTGGVVGNAIQAFATGGIARGQIAAARAAGDTVAGMLSPGEAVFQAQAWNRMQEAVVQATERGSGGGAVNIALTLRGRGGYDAAFEKIIGQAFTAEARRQGASARTAREVASPGFVNLPDVAELVNEG